tara:strand:+ start:949 stop:1383 length:435 start_codon:yes stop_codon:yes gene_type:complete
MYSKIIELALSENQANKKIAVHSLMSFFKCTKEEAEEECNKIIPKYMKYVLPVTHTYFTQPRLSGLPYIGIDIFKKRFHLLDNIMNEKHPYIPKITKYFFTTKIGSPTFNMQDIGECIFHINPDKICIIYPKFYFTTLKQYNDE